MKLPLSAATAACNPARAGAGRHIDGSCAETLALTYGTFDLFHVGHVRLFERIKRCYDRLVVAVSTDEFNAVKGKRAVMPYADRAELVAACRHVDEVIPEIDWTQKPLDVRRLGANAVVMGDDWTGRFDELRRWCDVVYLPRTEGVSSSLLKSDVVACGGRPGERR